MTTLDAITEMASQSALDTLGALHEDGGTLVLFGPKEPGFWDQFISSPEYGDGEADPLDRWSTRVIEAMAQVLGARALFPFQSDPYLPFYRWSEESGALWSSPVRLLVHSRQGLMVSVRGALWLPQTLTLPAPPASPCQTCAAQPCRTACPVGALTEAGYNTDACHAYLDTPEGAECLNGGCKVRLSCPAGANYGRLEEQSA
ncbi:MAG: ferredoxin, partial [Pseudomonadota bacterium]